MPTDIAGSVTPEYTASIPVPADGDFATSAALIAAYLPIANRVAFLKDQLIDAPDRAQAGFVEDWSGFVADGGGSLVTGDAGVWSILFTNSPSIAAVAADADGYGALRWANAAGSVVQARMQKPAAAALSLTSRFACRVAIANVSDCKFECGLLSVVTNDVKHADNDGVSLVFDPSLSPNWHLRTNDGSNQVDTDTGVTCSAGQYYYLEILPAAGGGWLGKIDGVAVATRDTSLPSGALATRVAALYEFGSSGASRQVDVDLFAYQAAIGRGL